MATCAARLCSIRRGRVRGHSGARICAPRAHRCSPLSTFVVCAPRVIAGGCCCCSGASIDERARPDAAARCSTSACITRNNLSHWEQSQVSALHGFRWAVVAPRWLRWLPRALWPPQAIRSRVVCVGRGPGAHGRCPQCMGCLGRVVQASVVCYSGAIALVRSSVRNLGVPRAATTLRGGASAERPSARRLGRLNLPTAVPCYLRGFLFHVSSARVQHAYCDIPPRPPEPPVPPMDGRILSLTLYRAYSCTVHTQQRGRVSPRPWRSHTATLVLCTRTAACALAQRAYTQIDAPGSGECACKSHLARRWIRS